MDINEIINNRDSRDKLNRRIECILEISLNSNIPYPRQFFINNFLYEKQSCYDEETKSYSPFKDKFITKKLESHQKNIDKYDKEISSLQEALRKNPNNRKLKEQLNSKLLKLYLAKKKYYTYYYKIQNLTIPQGILNFTKADILFIKKVDEMFKTRKQYEQLKRNQWEKFDFKDRSQLYGIIKKILTFDNRWRTFSFGHWDHIYHWQTFYDTELNMIYEKIFYPNLYRIKQTTFISVNILQNKKDYLIDKHYYDIFEQKIDIYMNDIYTQLYDKNPHSILLAKLNALMQLLITLDKSDISLYKKRLQKKHNKFEKELNSFHKLLQNTTNLLFKERDEKEAKEKKHSPKKATNSFHSQQQKLFERLDKAPNPLSIKDLMYILDLNENTALEYLNKNYIKGILNEENQWEISKQSVEIYLIDHLPWRRTIIKFK